MEEDFARARTLGGRLSRQHHDTYPYIDPKKVNLKGKSVLITGASKGIGKATAISYAQAGASNIALGARSYLDSTVTAVLEAAKAAGHPPPRITTLNLDVTSASSVSAAALQVSKDFDGRLDILINNAGYLHKLSSIPDSDPEDWWRTFEVNIKGPYLIFHAFYPLLRQSSLKTVINVVSLIGVSTLPQHSGYALSKLAALRLTQYISQDHGEGKEGIVAIGVHPGAIATDMTLTMPEELHHVLTETKELAGDAMVWLGAERREWLGGRYVSVCWDFEELSEKKGEIVEGDLLKIRLVV
ncbi:hypothetical protein COCCADRAFT_31899 [Bipolaris zeicola 26-R-13]|uniref:Oxidoreductase n=1 Tax=Cochliobolus carbonum (strain 26-R-13) TaxID=930089 RepID=W6Z684_COCC2|nr:uncharacterized protein COCCADRAFT_31899 [Bipolaris zeicola 26-R-13]EUC39176.1 hypothetical protein COCCADRAFT_31899 [Bipolaris zeicola 26-R-13]